MRHLCFSYNEDGAAQGVFLDLTLNQDVTFKYTDIHINLYQKILTLAEFGKAMIMIFLESLDLQNFIHLTAILYFRTKSIKIKKLLKNSL